MSEADSSDASTWRAVLTWRAHDVSRMESARVQVSGDRIKAYGRIVAAATPEDVVAAGTHTGRALAAVLAR